MSEYFLIAYELISGGIYSPRVSFSKKTITFLVGK